MLFALSSPRWIVCWLAFTWFTVSTTLGYTELVSDYQDSLDYEDQGQCEACNFDYHDFLDYDDAESEMATLRNKGRAAITGNYCKPNKSFIWCLPINYDREKHPFSFSKYINKPLPWNYDFKFVIEEISNVNDKAQTLSISMYFGVSWLDPRIRINASAPEWTEARTGPKNEINISPDSLKYIWYPELEIYGLERFGRQRVLKEMSGVRIRKNKTIHYELGVRITISCRMNFDDYPLDAHTCQFQVGSYYDTNKIVQCTSTRIYDPKRQRSLQHYISFEELPDKDMNITLPSGTYAACGFQIQLVRKQMQYLIQVYLPSCMFVVVSWVSFLIKPEVVPGRMAMLVTLFLVLINIFNSVRERAPISSRLNAIDLYLVVCIFLVFGALLEYAVILLLLKRRRKPKYTIDTGLKKMFSSNNGATSGSRALRQRMPLLHQQQQQQQQQQQSGANSSQEQQQQQQMSTLDNVEDAELQTPIIVKPRPLHIDPDDEDAYEQSQLMSLDPQADLAASEHYQHIKAICDNIDAWSMWLSPPAFIIFNLVYLFSYHQFDFDPPEPGDFESLYGSE